MAKSANQKMKLLALREILLEETDDEHGLTTPQIIERLAERGISAERKALYNDFDILREAGLDIIVRHESTTEYAIGARDFEFPELLLLVDSVQSSRFLTERKSKNLIAKLKKLTSIHQAHLLDKHIYVEGRIKSQNDSIYYNVDTIQMAIQNKKKITFKYFKYNLKKERTFRKDKESYSENPIALVYIDEYYYLIAYSDSHENFVTYRVDRMIDIEISTEAISRNQAIATFDVQDYTSQAFHMFSGEKESITLLVDESIMGTVIDRFGKEVLSYEVDENTARIHVEVMKSKVFFGWLTQFGTQVKIESPRSLAKEYCDYLKTILTENASY